MKRISYLLFILVLSILSCSNDQKNGDQEIISAESLFTAMESNRQWPSYRGFFAPGYLDNAALPDSFNIESGHHVKWNIEIPGLGLSNLH